MKALGKLPTNIIRSTDTHGAFIPEILQPVEFRRVKVSTLTKVCQELVQEGVLGVAKVGNAYDYYYLKKDVDPRRTRKLGPIPAQTLIEDYAVAVFAASSSNARKRLSREHLGELFLAIPAQELPQLPYCVERLADGHMLLRAVRVDQVGKGSRWTRCIGSIRNDMLRLLDIPRFKDRYARRFAYTLIVARKQKTRQVREELRRGRTLPLPLSFATCTDILPIAAPLPKDYDQLSFNYIPTRD